MTNLWFILLEEGRDYRVSALKFQVGPAIPGLRSQGAALQVDFFRVAGVSPVPVDPAADDDQTRPESAL